MLVLKVQVVTLLVVFLHIIYLQEFVLLVEIMPSNVLMHIHTLFAPKLYLLLLLKFLHLPAILSLSLMSMQLQVLLQHV